MPPRLGFETRSYTFGDLGLASAEVVIVVLVLLAIVGLEFRLLQER